MGNRQFYNQMIIDACQHHQDKITSELDINTMKDFMQVCLLTIFRVMHGSGQRTVH